MPMVLSQTGRGQKDKAEIEKALPGRDGLTPD